MAADSAAAGVDPDPYLDRIAFAALAGAMFGIAATDRRLDAMGRDFSALRQPGALAPRAEEREPYGRLVAMARTLGGEIVAARDGIASESRSVLGDILRDDPAHLHDEVLLGNLVLLLLATWSNVRGVLAWALAEYGDHPECGQSMRAAAARGATPDVSIDTLGNDFVRETLRMHQSEYFFREVVREIRIGPYRVPKGWLVRVCVRECHDRADVFPRPERFDPGRFAGRQYSRTEYCPFSDGTHSCFGAGLATMVSRTLVTTLATGFDMRTLTDGAPVRAGNRHWCHWRPSRVLRVALTSREGIDARLA
jgi:cytochrome P450